MSPCILSKKLDDSNVTLLNDGLTHWAKVSSGSLVDHHVSVL